VIIEDFYYLASIFLLFSTVQSIFGVGLLLFGTPTLLLSEYSYRTNIAFVYLMFGLSQLFVLVVVSSQTISPNAIWYIIISLLSYTFVSKLIAPRIDDKKYQSLITGFILLYGFVSIL